MTKSSVGGVRLNLQPEEYVVYRTRSGRMATIGIPANSYVVVTNKRFICVDTTPLVGGQRSISHGKISSMDMKHGRLGSTLVLNTSQGGRAAIRLRNSAHALSLFNAMNGHAQPANDLYYEVARAPRQDRQQQRPETVGTAAPRDNTYIAMPDLSGARDMAAQLLGKSATAGSVAFNLIVSGAWLAGKALHKHGKILHKHAKTAFEKIDQMTYVDQTGRVTTPREMLEAKYAKPIEPAASMKPKPPLKESTVVSKGIGVAYYSVGVPFAPNEGAESPKLDGFYPSQTTREQLDSLSEGRSNGNGNSHHNNGHGKSNGHQAGNGSKIKPEDLHIFKIRKMRGQKADEPLMKKLNPFNNL